MTSGAQRFLIVNADDFGQSPGVNRGIIEAHERGIVTSASLMVRWPAAVEAAAYCARAPALGLGLHVDLGEWRLRAGGLGRRLRARSTSTTPARSRAEIERQLDVFRELAGRDPTHLDSHQHVHLRPELRPLFVAVAERLGAPAARAAPEASATAATSTARARTARRDRTRSVARPWPAILAALRPGATELACHPARDAELDTMYVAERDREVDTLCAPSIRSAVARLGLHLCSFGTLPAAARRTA